MTSKLKMDAGFARSIIVESFSQTLLDFFHEERSLTVAIVGGYATDPEIQEMIALGFNLTIDYLGVDKNSRYLNLNELNKNFEGRYDLVICSQVLEHVWNYASAFQNLGSLVRSGGLLWISCPYSNRAHGFPDFYSAGLTSEFLTRNLEHIGMKVIFSSEFGSRRLYQALHSMPVWLSKKGNFIPVLFAFDDRPLWKAILLRIRYLPDLLILQIKSSKVNGNPLTNTDSCIAATTASSLNRSIG